MNRAILIGRLTKQPELRYTPQGTANSTFTIAVDGYKDHTDFISIVTWKGTAEACANHLDKGSLVGVEGRINTRNYEKDGRKIYITEIIADNVKFLDTRKADKKADPFAESGKEIEISDKDLPF
jgi:single-strand DNA-binding protein